MEQPIADEWDQRVGPATLVRAVFDDLDDFVALWLGTDFRLAAANATWRR